MIRHVPRHVRVFASILARELSITLTYRAWLALLQLSNLIVPTISLLVWRGALTLGATPPVSPDFLVTYFVLVALVSMLTSSWTTRFLAESIRLGGLSSWLVRPCSTHLNSLANNVSEKLVKLALLLPMIGVLAFALRGQFRLPSDPWPWLAFTAALVLAAVITFCLDIIIGSLAFWFEDTTGVDRFRSLAARVLSGAVVPLALFPDAVSGLLRVQPFRFMLSFPLEVLLGSVSGSAAAGFAWQTGWAVAFALSALATWRIGLRRYQGAGA